LTDFADPKRQRQRRLLQNTHEDTSTHSRVGSSASLGESLVVIALRQTTQVHVVIERSVGCTWVQERRRRWTRLVQQLLLLQLLLQYANLVLCVSDLVDAVQCFSKAS
jgi:hypothetical protein